MKTELKVLKLAPRAARRRKILRAKGYRMLNPSEKLKRGDEIRWGGKWMPIKWGYYSEIDAFASDCAEVYYRRPVVVPRLRAVGWIIRGKHCFDAEWEEGGKIVRTEDTYPTAKAARDAATAGWLARHNGRVSDSPEEG